MVWRINERLTRQAVAREWGAAGERDAFFCGREGPRRGRWQKNQG